MWTWISFPQKREYNGQIHSFNKYQLSTYHMPSTVVGTGNTPVNKTVKVLALMGPAWYLGRDRGQTNRARSNVSNSK